MPVLMSVFVVIALVMSFPVLLPAGFRCFGDVAKRTEVAGADDRRRGWRQAALAVALVGGDTGRLLRRHGEPTACAGVVVLEERTVVILRHQGVVGREVDVDSIRADA